MTYSYDYLSNDPELKELCKKLRHSENYSRISNILENIDKKTCEYSEISHISAMSKIASVAEFKDFIATTANKTIIDWWINKLDVFFKPLKEYYEYQPYEDEVLLQNINLTESQLLKLVAILSKNKLGGLKNIITHPNCNNKVFTSIVECKKAGYIHKKMAKIAPQSLIDIFISAGLDARSAIARRKDLSGTQLEVLANDSHADVRKIISKRKDIDDRCLEILLRHKTKDIAKSEAFSLLFEKKPHFGGLIAKQKNCSQSLKEKIKNSVHSETTLTNALKIDRKQSVENDTVKEEITIAQLKTAKALTDIYKESPEFLVEIIENPKCSKALLRKGVSEYLDISKNPRVQIELIAAPDSIGDYLPTNGATIDIAKNTECIPLMHYLYKIQPYALASNPCLPTELKWKLLDQNDFDVIREIIKVPGLDNTKVERVVSTNLDDLDALFELLDSMHSSYTFSADFFKQVGDVCYKETLNYQDELNEFFDNIWLKSGKVSKRVYNSWADHLGIARLYHLLSRQIENYPLIEPCLDEKMNKLLKSLTGVTC